MPTINVADKPTLDEVKALLQTGVVAKPILANIGNTHTLCQFNNVQVTSPTGQIQGSFIAPYDGYYQIDLTIDLNILKTSTRTYDLYCNQVIYPEVDNLSGNGYGNTTPGKTFGTLVASVNLTGWTVGQVYRVNAGGLRTPYLKAGTYVEIIALNCGNSNLTTECSPIVHCAVRFSPYIV